MKITDYGLWFKNLHTQTFTKIPKGKTNHLFLNGVYIGRLDCDGPNYFYVSIEALKQIGFRVNPESPGKKSGYGFFWNFPIGYIPTDSDFQELP